MCHSCAAPQRPHLPTPNPNPTPDQVLATHTEAHHQKLQQMARAILDELDKAR